MRRHITNHMIVLVAALVLGAAAQANILEGPPYVIVEEDGSFSFDVVFTAGSHGADLSEVLVRNGGNTDLGETRDGFSCETHVEPGGTYPFRLEGYLVDERVTGRAVVELLLCDERLLVDQTVIFRYGTVPTDSETRGAIKATYR